MLSTFLRHLPGFDPQHNIKGSYDFSFSEGTPLASLKDGFLFFLHPRPSIHQVPEKPLSKLLPCDLGGKVSLRDVI